MGTPLRNENNIKLGIITSRGGHLFQLYRLASWWKHLPHFIVTLPGKDGSDLLSGETVYHAYGPVSRNPLAAVINIFRAIYILYKERPTHLVSCGAGIAPPFFIIGKLLGMHLIFIEPYDFIAFPSLTGKLVYPITDTFLVQHEIQKKFFPKGQFRGATL